MHSSERWEHRPPTKNVTFETTWRTGRVHRHDYRRDGRFAGGTGMISGTGSGQPGDAPVIAKVLRNDLRGATQPFLISSQ